MGIFTTNDYNYCHRNNFNIDLCRTRDYKKDLIHKDNQYRIEWSGWFITPCGLPSLFVKDGIFERQMLYTKNYCLSKSGIDSVKMLEITSDTVTVIFYHHSDWKDIPKPIITKAYKQ